jgi:uroporphyrinogen-III synthase
MAFAGLRVLSLESRRATEIERLILSQHGVPFVAPAVREVDDAVNPNLDTFAARLFAGEFDMGVFLTGVGTRALHRIVSASHPDPALGDALRAITIAARGPKPVAALRELGVPAHIVAPEPNTSRELLAALEGRTGKRIFVQEYGRPNADLVEALLARAAEVTPVHVYNWELPEDREPLREAVRRVIAGEADVVIFTTAIQYIHLVRIAQEMGLEPQFHKGLSRTVIASIGPTTSATLREHGLEPDMEPSHPKMGFLVKEAAELSPVLHERKRSHEAAGR